MILVIGANGMLGRDLMTLLGDRGLGVDIAEIDITSPESVLRVVGEIKPEVVIMEYAKEVSFSKNQTANILL